MSDPQRELLAACSDKFDIPKNQLLTMGFLHFACVLERLDPDLPLVPAIATEFLTVVRELQPPPEQQSPPEPTPEAEELIAAPEEDVEPDPEDMTASALETALEPESEPTPDPEPTPQATQEPEQQSPPPPAPSSSASAKPPPQAAPAAEFRPELGKQLQEQKAARRATASVVDPYAAELHPARRDWFNSSPPTSHEAGVKGERSDGKESIIDFG